MRKTILVWLLVGVIVAPLSDAAGPILTDREYNAAMTYASKYFLSYREEYGADIRMAAYLKACKFVKLSEQLDRELPRVLPYVVNKFERETENISNNVSRADIALIITLATQNLLDGYRFGYQEAKRDELEDSGRCKDVPKLYESYLQTKQKPRK